VKALAALKAYDTLIEFLDTPHEATDPVERVGDEVVTNAAARVLAGLREACIFELLMRLAETRPLPGVIGALGTFGRSEAIPYLIEALAEDESRPAAEAALRTFGPFARQALAVAACQSSPSLERESESRLRQRRSALELLAEIGIQPEAWPIFRNLMRDQDPKITVLACKICLVCAPETEKREAISGLISLLPRGDFVLKQDIERCLASYFGRAEQ
jgi:HEAT repeat protein